MEYSAFQMRNNTLDSESVKTAQRISDAPECSRLAAAIRAVERKSGWQFGVNWMIVIVALQPMPREPAPEPADAADSIRLPEQGARPAIR